MRAADYNQANALQRTPAAAAAADPAELPRLCWDERGLLKNQKGMAKSAVIARSS
jgi:hypothetical protein